MKIKIFSGESTVDLEKDIQKWLTNNESILIEEIIQSESMNDRFFNITMTFLYHEME